MDLMVLKFEVQGHLLEGGGLDVEGFLDEDNFLDEEGCTFMMLVSSYR